MKNSVLTELRKLIQYQILLLEENEAGYRFVLVTSPGSCAPCRYLEETLDTRQQALVTKADPVNRSRAEWRIQDGAKLWEKVTNVAEFLGDGDVANGGIQPHIEEVPRSIRNFEAKIGSRTAHVPVA